MSDINPNTPVTETTGKTVLNGSESQTMDELDNLFLPREHRVKGPKKTATAKTEVEAKVEPEKKDGTTKDLSQHGKSSALKEKSEEPSSKAQAKEDGEEKDQKLAEAKARKAFKGKFQDKDLDLDEDAEFEVTVNGKPVLVKARDLFSNYSGKVAWEKKFSEVNLEKQKLFKDSQRFDGMKSQIKAMFDEKDPNVRLFRVAQLAGMDPVAYRKQFFDQTMKDIETYASMTDDERKARDLEFEGQWHKHQADAMRAELDTHKSQAELRDKVDTILKTTGIPEKQFVERFHELERLEPQTRAILEREGKIVQGEPTAEFIVETIQKEGLWNATFLALNEAKVDMKEDAKAKAVNMLIEDAYRDGMKPEDMADIVSEIWGKGRAKRVVEKTEKAREEHFSGKRDVPSYQNTGSDPTFFGDI